MLINKYDINDYGAMLVDKKISPSKTESQVEWLNNSNIPISLANKTKFCNVSCKLNFEANSEDEFEKIFSVFNKDIKECVVNFNNISLNYYCYLEEISTPIKIVQGCYEVEVIWKGYKYADEIIENLNKVSTKTNTGNLDTPCVVEILPSIDIIDLKIEGLSDDPITIRNLKQGQKVIINGEDGTVLENGANKFGDTDMWEFPRLKPGANTITLSKSSTDINIKYKPRWI